MNENVILWWVTQYKNSWTDKKTCKNFAQENLTPEEYAKFLTEIE